MKIFFSISPVKKLIIAGLIIAFIGVVTQILSNVPYPKVPPVLFILLIPVGLLIFSRWRWLPILIILAALFLILGLFSSGASARLVNFTSIGGSIGLWVQMIGVVFAMVAAIASLVQNYGTKKIDQ
jgi:hypothetical protein